jgi:hypothetical protein
MRQAPAIKSAPFFYGVGPDAIRDVPLFGFIAFCVGV